MRSFNKLSADTILRAHSKNTRFVQGVRNLVKEIVICGHCFLELRYVSCIVSWHLYRDMYRVLRKCIVAALKISAAQNHNALPFPYAFAVKRHLFIVTYNPKSSEFDADMGKELPCHY